MSSVVYVDSINEAVIAAFIDRLKGIRNSDGYATNAGLNVYDSMQTFEPEMYEGGALSVWDDGEAPVAGTADGSQASMMVGLTVSVDALAAADRADTGLTLRALKRDVKRRLLQPDWLGLATQGRVGVFAYRSANPLPRRDGSDVEGVRMQFVVTYKEGFGDPDRSL